MSLQYNDPDNQMLPIQPAPAPAPTGGFVNFVKNNKLAVAIGLLLLIGLIWWFCIRKKTGTPTVTNISTSPNLATNGTNIKITKTRPGAY